MKRVYNLIFVLNVFIGLFLFANYFLLNNFSFISIILCIFVSIIYIFCAYFYSNKKYKTFEIIDKIFINFLIVCMLGLLLFSTLSQISFTEVYLLLYYNLALLILHIILMIYYLNR